jgi:hypothetical protein
MPKLIITITDAPTKDEPDNVHVKCESSEPIKPEALTAAQRLAQFMLDAPAIMKQLANLEEDEDPGEAPEDPSLN